jgi:hypothetical protein
MSKARNLARLIVDSSGDVDSSALGNVDALPSQSGNSGKYLTTDGTDASWETISGGFSGSTTVSQGTSLTLTSSSTQTQYISFTASGLSVILPDATTLTTKGTPVFVLINNGYVPFFIKNSAGTVIGTIATSQTAIIGLTDNSTSVGAFNINIIGSIVGFPGQAADASLITGYSGSVAYYWVWFTTTQFMSFQYYTTDDNSGSRVWCSYQVWTISNGYATAGTARTALLNTFTTDSEMAGVDLRIGQPFTMSSTSVLLHYGGWYDNPTNADRYFRKFVRVATLSGDTLSFGGEQQYFGNATESNRALITDNGTYGWINNQMVIPLTDASFLVMYNTGMNYRTSTAAGAYTGSLRMVYNTISGNTITKGANYDLASSTGYAPCALAVMSDSKYVVMGSVANAANGAKIVVVTRDGTTLTWGTPITGTYTMPNTIQGNGGYFDKSRFANNTAGRAVLFNVTGQAYITVTVSGTTPTIVTETLPNTGPILYSGYMDQTGLLYGYAPAPVVVTEFSATSYGSKTLTAFGQFDSLVPIGNWQTATTFASIGWGGTPYPITRLP